MLLCVLSFECRLLCSQFFRKPLRLAKKESDHQLELDFPRERGRKDRIPALDGWQKCKRDNFGQQQRVLEKSSSPLKERQQKMQFTLDFGPNWGFLDGIIYFLHTVFENHRKSLIQYCERCELRLHFEWTIVDQKCQKLPILASFWKPEACGQTVLPDRSVLIGQKLVENAEI